MTNINPDIEESWKNVLKEEFEKPYFPSLKRFLLEEKKQYKIYPPGPQIFAAFNHTPFHKVKVVILGQDPYHGPGQAHGLCFSVPRGIMAPPSLQNIFREIHNDLNIPIPAHGNLEKWTNQGVLLLNATLTVRANQAGSHQKKGWEIFTDSVIATLSREKSNLVFLLWGNYAQQKTILIDSTKHLLLKSVHPSPLSAARGFFGCKHFSQTNIYLQQNNIEPIDWDLNKS
ncbi:MAG: uracil-DNA glycosylase [Bacteroidetes bacterium]|nr:MAG: uracil-DNA glycosylase [Bacteroidota bacterium]